jgi:hypothetical protein
MFKLPRFGINPCPVILRADGDWVRWDDVNEQVDRLEAALRFAAMELAETSCQNEAPQAIYARLLESGKD